MPFSEPLPSGCPDVRDLERLIAINSAERRRLMDTECSLRKELQEIMRQRLPADLFEEVRNRERDARADLTRNLEQYDVLMEKWAAEGTTVKQREV